ncbi:hypothetical protein TSUD_381140 [Trifolium subterraneum]|uniref:Uncharacterized protein n=1 Tax=Trifolium subterraneum TaxID=3900 RepID=A0A2Z6N472_TRISU|nr:hypothetical protein TSUD_381140 [Trifolium subterraneum]
MLKMVFQSEFWHCGNSSNSWREVCNSENEDTYVCWVAARHFAVVTDKDKLSGGVGMATLSGGFNGGIIVGVSVALKLSFGGVLNNNLSNMACLCFSQSNIGSAILNSFTQNHGSFIVHVGARLASNRNGFSHVVESRWSVFGGSGGGRVESHREDSESIVVDDNFLFGGVSSTGGLRENKNGVG